MGPTFLGTSRTEVVRSFLFFSLSRGKDPIFNQEMNKRVHVDQIVFFAPAACMYCAVHPLDTHVV